MPLWEGLLTAQQRTNTVTGTKKTDASLGSYRKADKKLTPGSQNRDSNIATQRKLDQDFPQILVETLSLIGHGPKQLAGARTSQWEAR